MPTFSEAFLFARRRNAGKQTGKRFREILQIVRAHNVFSGLTPQDAVSLLEDLGPTFVKLGQIASSHPDMLPKEYCQEFAKLRTQVTPMDFGTVKEVVERELDRPLGEVFSDFDEHAVGSASIAQVHRAVLAETGTVVAVKVQRPEVVETVAEDLSIMERIIELYDFVVPDDSRISLKELLDELARTSRDELDFRVEAHSIARFHANNLARENVCSPRCYEEYTTSALLVEDYFSSPCVEDIEGIVGLSESQREDIAYLMAHNYVQQVLDDGFFHADPHAGNVLIASECAIEWIDFGMMGTLTSREREQVMSIAKAMARGDAYGLQRSLLKVIEPVGSVDHGKLVDICEMLIDEFVDVSLESFDMSALINTLLDSLSGAGYKIAPFLMTLGRGLVTFEGTVKFVSDKLSIMSVITEYIQDNLEFSSVSKRVRKVAATGMESAEAAIGLPSKAMNVLDMMQKGQLKVGMDIDVDKKFTDDITCAINNFAFAMLACGMIIGSCILCTTGLEPHILGIPVFGLVGFIFGTALMLYVSFLILSSRNRGRRR